MEEDEIKRIIILTLLVFVVSGFTNKSFAIILRVYNHCKPCSSIDVLLYNYNNNVLERDGTIGGYEESLEWDGLAGGYYYIEGVCTQATEIYNMRTYVSLADWHYSKDVSLECSDIVTTSTSSTSSSIANTSTTTTTSGGLCSSELIYGRDSEEAERLIHFRDNVLNQTPKGKELIRLYYQWSPVIVKAMEKDEEFKEEVKHIFDNLLELVGGV